MKVCLLFERHRFLEVNILSFLSRVTSLLTLNHTGDFTHDASR